MHVYDYPNCSRLPGYRRLAARLYIRFDKYPGLETQSSWSVFSHPIER